jgi:tetratricopeptide (TPR) repeat protein
MGMTLRAFASPQQAEDWWHRAMNAFDNLLGVLCTPQPPAHPAPRYQEALNLCDTVERQIYHMPVKRPLALSPLIPTTSIHRLQNLFYVKGNVQVALSHPYVAKTEYEKGIELALSPHRFHQPVSTPMGYSFVDLLIAVSLAGLLIMQWNSGASAPQNAAVLEVISLSGGSVLDRQGNIRIDLLALARAHSAALTTKLLESGGGILPMILLPPDAIIKVCHLVFWGTGGSLPVFAFWPPGQSGDQSRTAPTLSMTSALLLAVAKVFQDSLSAPEASAKIALGGKIPPSVSLILPLYYVALALHPSPSTYNNLGILLSTIASSTQVIDQNGQAREVNGQGLALQYYSTGLTLDRSHPHLFTNIGSLLKDMGACRSSSSSHTNSRFSYVPAPSVGHLQQAVQMYREAVNCNPNFDVALANLASLYPFICSC